jgi:hypothetical protein
MISAKEEVPVAVFVHLHVCGRRKYQSLLRRELVVFSSMLTMWGWDLAEAPHRGNSGQSR